MTLKFYFSLGVVLISFAAQAQEMKVPLTAMNMGNDDRSDMRYAQVTVQDTIVMPSTGVRDNFMYDSHRPDTTIWDVSLAPGVYVNRGWATCPINLGVCTFDGLDYAGYPYNQLASVNSSEVCDVLTSKPFDLTGYDISDSVYLSFWWEAQGRGYAPNQVDSLQLQVNIPAWNQFGEVWKTVWFMEGYNPAGADSSFHLTMWKLDSASYFTNGFRFRFRNYASACGSNDHWHIDEVKFKPNRTFADTLVPGQYFVYSMPSLFRNYHQVPGDHYDPVANMNNQVSMYFRNNDTVPANMEYYFQIFQPGNSTPLFTYNGGSNGFFMPFSTSGYSSYAAHNNPGFSYQYTPFTDTGYYIVNHVLVNNLSDSAQVSYDQRMYNTYAYDDGTAEVGYGLFGAGALLAYRFDMPSAVTDTLTAVQMYFLPVLDIDQLQYRDWRLTVWNHNTSTNGPGNIIYQQANQNPYYAPMTPNKFHTYTIDSGVVVVSGVFYVGWQQEGSDRLYIGMDLENDQGGNIYYNTSGVWYTSVYDGSLMIRPVFGEAYDVSGVEEPMQNSTLTFFPNPATEYISVSGLITNENYSATLTDLAGRIVSNQAITSNDNRVDLTGLARGVYVLTIYDGDRSCAGVQKIVRE